MDLSAVGVSDAVPDCHAVSIAVVNVDELRDRVDYVFADGFRLCALVVCNRCGARDDSRGWPGCRRLGQRRRYGNRCYVLGSQWRVCL